MEDASFRHGFVVTNLMGSLSQLWRKPVAKWSHQPVVCRFPEIRNLYPDVIVVGGKMEFSGNQRDTLLNPTVLFEVLSPSTADYDPESNSTGIGPYIH